MGSTSLPQPKQPPRGLHGLSRLIDEVISSSYHSLHNIPSIGLRFDAIYGPCGFGVSSASVPIFHVDHSSRLKRGVSADVGLAESAARNLYRKWTDAVNLKATQAEAEKDEDDEGEWRDVREDGGRRLEETRHVDLLKENGWTRSAHDQRDFAFVEGEIIDCRTAKFAATKVVSSCQFLFLLSTNTVHSLHRRGGRHTAEQLSDYLQYRIG